MFDNIKKMMELKKTMDQVKKRLDDMVIKVTSPSKYFEITISGSQEIKEVVVLSDLKDVPSKDIERDLKDIFNKAVKDSQVMAAQAMKEVTGFGF